MITVALLVAGLRTHPPSTGPVGSDRAVTDGTSEEAPGRYGNADEDSKTQAPRPGPSACGYVPPVGRRSSRPSRMGRGTTRRRPSIPVRPAEACFFTLAFAVRRLAGAWSHERPARRARRARLSGRRSRRVDVVLAVRRRKKFVKQLPEMLQLLASSLRAGYSLLQGCRGGVAGDQRPDGRRAATGHGRGPARSTCRRGT